MTKFADLVTFTEEILNGKLHFLCSTEKVQFICLEFERNSKLQLPKIENINLKKTKGLESVI